MISSWNRKYQWIFAMTNQIICLFPGGASDLVGVSADPVRMCPYCTFSTSDSLRLQQHIAQTHSQVPVYSCPLCQDNFADKSRIEHHLVSTHNVTQEGLQRLLVMVTATMPPVGHQPQSPSIATPQQPTEGSSDVKADGIELDAIRIGEDGKRIMLTLYVLNFSKWT